MCLISPLLVNGVSTAMKDLKQPQIEAHRSKKNQTHCSQSQKKNQALSSQSQKRNQTPCSCSKSQEKDEPLMTLNEAIRHAEEKGQGTSNCCKNHRQLARWLKELKQYRDRTRIVTSIPNKPETTASQIEKVYKAPMTLDEAISYADTKAGDRKTYMEQQYSRVAGWLQELKMRREIFPQKTEEEYASWLRKVKAVKSIDAEHCKKVDHPYAIVMLSPEIQEYLDKVVAEKLAAMSSNNTNAKDNKQSSSSTIPKDRGVKIDIKDIDDDDEYL